MALIQKQKVKIKEIITQIIINFSNYQLLDTTKYPLPT